MGPPVIGEAASKWGEVTSMNMFEAGLIDFYDNIERRMGDKAWLLPFAVAAGSFLFHRAFLNKSTARSLVEGTLTGASIAGLVGAGRAIRDTEGHTNGKLTHSTTKA